MSKPALYAFIDTGTGERIVFEGPRLGEGPLSDFDRKLLATLSRYDGTEKVSAEIAARARRMFAGGCSWRSECGAAWKDTRSRGEMSARSQGAQATERAPER